MLDILKATIVMALVGAGIYFLYGYIPKTDEYKTTVDIDEELFGEPVKMEMTASIVRRDNTVLKESREFRYSSNWHEFIVPEMSELRDEMYADIVEISDTEGIDISNIVTVESGVIKAEDTDDDKEMAFYVITLDYVAIEEVVEAADIEADLAYDENDPEKLTNELEHVVRKLEDEGFLKIKKNNPLDYIFG